jgi:hypothetical protein
MKAKERHKTKILEYLGNPDNEWLPRSRLSTEILGFKQENQIYRTFSPEELDLIEAMGLDIRRRKYIASLARIDKSLLLAAEGGDVSAIRLVYGRFEGWSEKHALQHTGDMKVGLSDVLDALPAEFRESVIQSLKANI